LPGEEKFTLKHSIPILIKQAQRIQCLTIPPKVLNMIETFQECQKFPYLHTLTLTNEGTGASLAISLLTVSRFPALQTLRWPRRFSFTSTSPTISPSLFPPLQHLSLPIGQSLSSMDILRSCAATLKTLHISCEGWETTPIQITLPLLRHLTVRYSFWSKEGPPLFKALTPVLTSLEVLSRSSLFPVFFDVDMQKVTHMRWSTFRKPLFCTHVRVLQIMVKPVHIDFINGYAACASSLKEIASAYPSLQRIELCSEMHEYPGHPGIVWMQQRVEECLGEEWGGPELLWTSRLEGELPGYMATTVRLVLHFSCS
jgi:hypothetical protein